MLHFHLLIVLHFLMQKKKLHAILKDWSEMVAWLSKAKEDEMVLRKQLIEHFFPDPTEGTNKVEYENHIFVFNNQYKRDIDQAVLDSVLEKLPEGTEDKCIKYKPSLIKKGYDALPAHLKKKFDQALIVKPGSLNLKVTAIEVKV